MVTAVSGEFPDASVVSLFYACYTGRGITKAAMEFAGRTLWTMQVVCSKRSRMRPVPAGRISYLDAAWLWRGWFCAACSMCCEFCLLNFGCL